MKFDEKAIYTQSRDMKSCTYLEYRRDIKNARLKW